MEYELVLERHPRYLHAIGRGRRTPRNAQRFLREAGEACMNAHLGALLVEFAFTGPALDPSSIFGVIGERSHAGMRLRKIAYLEAGLDNPQRAVFAETVARNRGVNVRLFENREAAVAWLLEPEEAS